MHVGPLSPEAHQRGRGDMGDIGDKIGVVDSLGYTAEGGGYN